MNAAGKGESALRIGVICARWAARVLGLLVVGVVVVFAVGEGFDPRELQPGDQLPMVAFVTTLAGLLVAWKRELLGGLLVIGGMTAFGMVGVAAHGDWGWSGPVFWTILSLGFVFAVCGVVSHGSPEPAGGNRTAEPGGDGED
jgi:peptidoglycan/LPS O-acetylase OafA/YrhL